MPLPRDMAKFTGGEGFKEPQHQVVRERPSQSATVKVLRVKGSGAKTSDAVHLMLRTLRACPLLSRGMATFSTSFYELKDFTSSGEEIDFSAFKGKVVYVQNVASR